MRHGQLFLKHWLASSTEKGRSRSYTFAISAGTPGQLAHSDTDPSSFLGHGRSEQPSFGGHLPPGRRSLASSPPQRLPPDSSSERLSRVARETGTRSDARPAPAHPCAPPSRTASAPPAQPTAAAGRSRAPLITWHTPPNHPRTRPSCLWPISWPLSPALSSPPPPRPGRWLAAPWHCARQRPPPRPAGFTPAATRRWQRGGGVERARPLPAPRCWGGGGGGGGVGRGPWPRRTAWCWGRWWAPSIRAPVPAASWWEHRGARAAGGQAAAAFRQPRGVFRSARGERARGCGEPALRAAGFWIGLLGTPRAVLWVTAMSCSVQARGDRAEFPAESLGLREERVSASRAQPWLNCSPLLNPRQSRGVRVCGRARFV